MRGRVGLGAGSGYDLGATGGEETHSLSVSELPSHTHGLTRRSNPDNGAFDTNNGHQNESSAATTDRSILGVFQTNSTGSGESHNNMQPYLALKYIIKV